MGIWCAVSFAVSGCESNPSGGTNNTIVAQSTGTSTATPAEQVWDGSGAEKIEFGRVIQNTPVIIEGTNSGWGTFGGGVAGGAAAAPKQATVPELVKGAVGVVGGAVVGKKVEEIYTRKDGQEILIGLDEGRVVTVTQDVAKGYFQEGDQVKIVHSNRGAYVSMTSPAEIEAIRETKSKKREIIWYEKQE